MKRPELYAAGLTVLLGAPLLYLFGVAAWDGVARHRQSALQAMIGADRTEQLLAFDDCVRRGGDLDGDTCENESGFVRAGFPHYAGRAFTAPDVEATDREGRTWRLREQRGKVIVMNFWSITCPPCIEEMPSVEELAEVAERWDDVEIVAVSTDAGWDTVRSVVPARPRVKHVFDSDKSAVEGKYGTKLYPETWIVDAEGVIRMRYDGGLDWSSPVVVDFIESLR